MTAKPTDQEIAATPLPADADRVVLAGESRTCDRVRGLLDEYLAGALTGLDRAGLDHHLSVCKACRTVADEYLEVVRLAGSLPPAHPSPDAEARLREFIARALARSNPAGR